MAPLQAPRSRLEKPPVAEAVGGDVQDPHDVRLGVKARNIDKDVGNFLTVSSLLVLGLNALPSHVMRFTGNIGEVALQVGFLK